MYSFLEPELRSDDEDSDSDESPVEDTEETHNVCKHLFAFVNCKDNRKKDRNC